MKIGKDTGFVFDYGKYVKEMSNQPKFEKGDTVHVSDEVTGLKFTKTVIDVNGDEIILG